MQTVKPKAELPKSKEIKEVNNITDAINSKGFRNKLDNATEGTVLAKTKEGREIKYAGLDENGNDLFTVVRNGKTEAEEISLQELKKLKNLKLTSNTLPTKSVGADKAKPVESPKPVESLKPETKVNKTEVVEKESASKVGNFEVTAAKKGKDSLNAVADGTAEVMEATSKVKHAYRTAKQLLISGQEPLERMAKELKSTKVLDRVQAVRNANESVAYAFHKGIVSLKRGGIVKNKGLKHAFVVDGKKVKGKELKDYTTYAAHLHNIDRSKQFVYTYTKSNGAEVRVQALSLIHI